MSKKIDEIREFFMSSWAVDNRITTFTLTFIVTLLGVLSFQALPKEQFPEIAIPTIYVGTPYPGNSPENIEKNVTYFIEKELKAIKGVKEIKSQSIQDFSVIIVEFETDVDLDEAKDEVKEAVDKSKADLPSDLPQDPIVQDINLSEVPIMYVNVSGDLSPNQLKTYAEELQDQIEQLSEIRRVDLLGVQEKEVQVNLDLLKMEANGIAFGDITSAIGQRDVLISGGQVTIGERDYALQVDGKFKTVEEIGEIVVRNGRGASVFLKDIAEVKLDFEDAESYSRLDGKPTISLGVVKKAGENLISASDKITALLDQFEEVNIPVDLRDNFNLTVSADQSYLTKNLLSELTNTIIIGFLLVTIVLMFFMGLRDSVFVGLSVPLASVITFVVLPWIGFTLNLVVLFTFIFALGIVVDNAIVVVENTYRMLNQEGMSIKQAAKKAAGEVIAPVFAGTLTTMAPFLPLAFWEGIVGEFMFFLPITIIIILFASLLVAYVINPMFAATFMKPKSDNKGTSLKGFFIMAGTVALFMGLSYMGGSTSSGNTFLVVLILMLFYRFLVLPLINGFQNRVLPGLMSVYRRILRWAIRPWPATFVLVGTVFSLFLSIGVFTASNPKVVFFPEADPNYLYIYTQLEVGTDIEQTNEVTMEIERLVNEKLKGKEKIVKSTITNVAKGANSPSDFNQTAVYSNKSRIQVEFVPFKEREGISTAEILSSIRTTMQEQKRVNPRIPSNAVITVEKEPSGPPTAKPINIEVKGEDFAKVQRTADALYAHMRGLIDNGTIEGIEELKSDLESGKPQLNFNIDYTKASDLGMNTAQLGIAIRTAVFGSEVTQYREFEDEYPVIVRLAPRYRDDIDRIQDMSIAYRDMATGMFHNVPIRSVASVDRSEALGGINRLDLKKSITLYSNILSDYNANEVVYETIDYMEEWKEANPRMMEGVTVEMTGEILEQEETSAFLGSAMGIAMMLIFLILVAQFNSISQVFIIFTQIIFSVSGVFLGFGLSGVEMSIVMTGVGVVSLAGIVVNNGIILLDFFKIMRNRGMELKDAIVEGGATRFTPVLLTASSTVLGLVPLAVGLNINFQSLFTELNPEIFFGGDTAVFWGSLSLTVIYGLGFATIVTLIVVPVLYYVFNTLGVRITEGLRRIAGGIGDQLSK